MLSQLKLRQVTLFDFLTLMLLISMKSVALAQRNDLFAAPKRVSPPNNGIAILLRTPPTEPKDVSTQQPSPLNASLWAQGSVDKNNSYVSETTTLPLKRWKVVESDMLFPLPSENSTNDVKYGASLANIELWGKDPNTGNYVVPMIFPKATVIRKRLDWVIGYVSRGANIEFREKRPTDKKWVDIDENPNYLCQPMVGSGNGGGVYMNLHEDVCLTRQFVLHEILHVLGFHHEHQRPDRPDYIEAETFSDPMGRHTEFDPFSMTMYEANLIAPNASPEQTKFFRKYHAFMSTCDWNLLLTLYPGPNKPPKCRTKEIAKVLSPTPSFRSRSREDPDEICHLYSSFPFDAGDCVLPDGQEYPDLKKEFFSDDAIDLLQLRTKPKVATTKKPDKTTTTQKVDKITTTTKKPDKTTTTKKVDKITGTTKKPGKMTTRKPRRKVRREKKVTHSEEATGSVTSSSTVLLSPKVISSRSKSRFCHEYISRNTSILQHKECASACLTGCKQYVSKRSLTRCMRKKYSPCMRHRQRSSMASPISYGAFFVTSLFYISFTASA